jgi:hypothetical protein
VAGGVAVGVALLVRRLARRSHVARLGVSLIRLRVELVPHRRYLVPQTLHQLFPTVQLLLRADMRNEWEKKEQVFFFFLKTPQIKDTLTTKMM